MLCMAIGDTGRRIRAAREAFRDVGMKQTQLAEKIGVSQQRLQQWEAGKHDPPSALVRKVADALDVSLQYLLMGQEIKEVSVPLYPVSYPMTQLPYGGYVPAGDWTDPFDTDDLVEVDAKFDAKGRFACRIEGGSMFPFLHPGDLAIFQVYGSRRPVVGHVVLARRAQDNSVTVKELGLRAGEFVLKALDPSHESPVAPQWESVAFLVGIIRTKGTFTRSDYNPDGLRVADAL